eukprot:gene400-8023_t
MEEAALAGRPPREEGEDTDDEAAEEIEAQAEAEAEEAAVALT